MDKEQQIRINFLDEAEDCFDAIESVLIGLSSGVLETEELDKALRAAHSVKGGAGMMGFMPLSEVAHSLEDYFKILRVRYQSTKIDTEVETLLLQGLDNLRFVSQLHRQGTEIDDSWLNTNVHDVFARLNEILGELQEEDEKQLLNSDNNDVDSTLEMLQDGMEVILDEFEEKWHDLSSTELTNELVMTSEKLLTLARMSDLDPLIQLCESIENQATMINEASLSSFAQKALNLWQRSHGLIVRGSLEKLPDKLEGFESSLINNDFVLEEEAIDLQEELFETQYDDNLALLESMSGEEWDDFNNFVDSEFDVPEEHFEIDNLPIEEEEEEELNIELDSQIQEEEVSISLDSQIATRIESRFANLAEKSISKTIRVPVEQLYQFNNLFGKLILERNRVNLRLEQLKNYVALMRQRMNQLEKSNLQLRNWYDRASLEGIIPVTEEALPVNGSQSLGNRESYQGQFDALEMDRYSDLHIISQEQIETIVQLQEVSSDIEFGLQEMTQAVQELNHSSRSLQANVTRTQMIPFGEVVKPFPRLVRELSLSLGKEVNLNIEGSTTLLDRAIIETLNAPLIHLIRNAFDHGIEDSEKRINQGKSPQGKINLKAVNQGTQTIISVSDDGGGINLDKICDRLRDMGISNQEIRQMSEAQILDYIFQPGFTTSEQVTQISGRGVGMDVVRNGIKEIRGDIQVKTQAGKGTTFTITVPYTLSILRVMLVERMGMVLAVPAESVKQVFPLGNQGDLSAQNIEQIDWQDETIPVVRIEETLLFNRPRKPFEIQENPVIDKPTALIVGEQDNRGSLQIDRLWSEQEISIRPIDSPIPLPRGFISSTVLGDGRIVPVVDPVQIFQECLQRQTQATTSEQTEKKTHDTVINKPIETILIVDDSINVRRYLALTLEKAGYQVEEAKDGKEAVDKLLAGLSVQAVICDIEMPRLDGYGVLEEVKAKPEFQSLPIAMLTSRSNDKHRKLAMNLGASAYFSKPYNEQELINTMETLITH